MGGSWRWRKAAFEVVEQRKQRLNRGKSLLLDELKVCTNLQLGKRIHAVAIDSGYHSCIYIATALIKMYAKFRCMAHARQVFGGMEHPDVVSWTALILGYAENGEGAAALEAFARMKSQGCSPNRFTFVAALRGCICLAVNQTGNGRDECLERGKRIHSEARTQMDVYVQSTLVDMYAKFGSMYEAQRVFDDIKHPSLVSWTILIMGYAERGEGVRALDLFASMSAQGFQPDSFAFVAALKACTSIQPNQERAQRVKHIHSRIDCPLDVRLQNALVDAYSKSDCMAEARRVFDGIKHRDVVSWNALMLGYAETGEGLKALHLLQGLKSQGLAPNSVTFIAALKACASLSDRVGIDSAECLVWVKRIRSDIGCLSDVYVQNTLIDTYAKLGGMSEARRVFEGIKVPSVVSWNALIKGYAAQGEGLIALDLFQRMKSKGCCAPNSLTFVAALKACTALAAPESLKRGKQIHSEIGPHSDNNVHNTLIYMYAKGGSMVEARRAFDGMKRPDVVSWTALILGCAENGEARTALNLFARMISEGCAPNSCTFAAALRACSLLVALETGRKIHAEIDMGTSTSSRLLTSLVDFYAKCGDVGEAQRVFDSHPRARSLTAWTALLAGYSRLGDSESAFQLFERMQDAGVRPDAVTVLCMLTCCCHAGLVEKANELFGAMSTKYRMTPSVEHYTCMVDMLGRCNKLDDALSLLRSMPRPNAVTWMTLLDACRKWRNVDVGRVAFQSLLTLDDTNPAAYVLMAQVHGCQEKDGSF